MHGTTKKIKKATKCIQITVSLLPFLSPIEFVLH
jgi:hypothetical protein